MRALHAAATMLVASAAWAQAAAAQQPRGIQPEVRVDVLAPHPAVAQLGAGVEIPAGWYARLELDAAGGVARDDHVTTGSARGDAIVRFLLDPFGESRWGLSMGGGVSVRYDPLRGWREYLAVVADLEGPSAHPVVPAVQMGLGGGVRVGFVLRRGMTGRR